jgi:hypothetical protein
MADAADGVHFLKVSIFDGQMCGLWMCGCANVQMCGCADGGKAKSLNPLIRRIKVQTIILYLSAGDAMCRVSTKNELFLLQILQILTQYIINVNNLPKNLPNNSFLYKNTS